MPLTLSLALGLLLSQTSPSSAEARGAVLALHAAQADLANRTITASTAGQRCVGFSGGGSAPTGAVTIRVGVALLSDNLQRALGVAPTQDADGNDLPWAYGALEIQAVPDATSSVVPALPAWLRILDTDEVERRASAVWPACQVAFVRADSPQAILPWRCGCSTGAACTWTPPLQGGGYGAAVALPKGTTAPPGAWTGTGCRRKPCVEWAGADSMPAVCR